MFKKLFIIFFLIISISNFCNANVITLTSENEFEQNSFYDVSININFNKIDEKIYFLQGQLNYDTNIFEKIEADDIILSNGWHDIVFNSDNGMFVVEYDNLNNLNTQEIMKINFKTKNNMQAGNTSITITNIKIIGENQIESEINSHTIEVKLISTTNNNNNVNNYYDNQSNMSLPFLGSNASKIYILIGVILITLYVLSKKIKNEFKNF